MLNHNNHTFLFSINKINKKYLSKICKNNKHTYYILLYTTLSISLVNVLLFFFTLTTYYNILY